MDGGESGGGHPGENDPAFCVMKRKWAAVKTVSHGHKARNAVGQVVAGNGLDQDALMAEVWEEEERRCQNVMASDWK